MYSFCQGTLKSLKNYNFYLHAQKSRTLTAIQWNDLNGNSLCSEGMDFSGITQCTYCTCFSEVVGAEFGAGWGSLISLDAWKKISNVWNLLFM